MPLEGSPVTIALLENKPVSKAIPMATVRSSKLAAMAANMNKTTDADHELDLDTTDMEEDVQDNDPTLVKLEDILIVPEIINENAENNENVEFSENNGNSETSENDIAFDQFNKVDTNTEQDNRRESYTNGAGKCSERDKVNCNGEGTSNTKHLSLSCIIPSAISDATYRLGSM